MVMHLLTKGKTDIRTTWWVSEDVGRSIHRFQQLFRVTKTYSYSPAMSYLLYL